MVRAKIISFFLVIESGFSFAPSIPVHNHVVSSLTSFTASSPAASLSDDSNNDSSRVLVKSSVHERLGDGSRRRFAKLMMTLRKKSALDLESARARVKSFEVFDTNKDGVVDLEELRVGLAERFGLVCTDDELKAAADKYDANKNGILEVEEFAVGLIKRTIELGQDAKKAEAKALALRQKQASAPLFSKLRSWIGDKGDDSDNDNGRGGGGGGGGGLGALARAPALVPVPVQKKGEFDF